jgi:chromosomal replication initiation ATPase DnaA
MTQGEKIIEEAIGRHGISRAMLLGDSRRPEIVKVRRAIAKRLRDELELSYNAIGRVLKRDGTTILGLISPAYAARKDRWRRNKGAA